MRRLLAVGARLGRAEETEQAGYPQLAVREPAGPGDDQLDAADAGQLERGHQRTDAHGVDESYAVHVELDALGTAGGELSRHGVLDLVRVLDVDLTHRADLHRPCGQRRRRYRQRHATTSTRAGRPARLLLRHDRDPTICRRRRGWR